MNFVVDSMGGDNAPEVIVEGAIQAIKKLEKDDIITLVGDSERVGSILKEYGYRDHRIMIVHASDVITNDEAPVKAVRRKKDSSIVKGLNLVKDGKGDVFMSAGSTGAVLAGGLLILGRIKGVDRPTLASLYPVIGHEPSLIADAGANAECKPRNLLEFAKMGSIYMEKVLGRENPTVGLINNGTEEGKGTSLTKEAYELLEKSELNFVGNIETRELQNAVADVIITDGFTGNAVIKLTEGLGLMVLREIKKMYLDSPRTKVGALFVQDKLRNLKHQFDYKEYGGAPILGVKGAVLKMHGSSDAVAVRQTILKSRKYVEEDVVGIITEAIR
ncbi:MAG: phosphate acyltransferase PlsX [Eubacterium sp.]|nr:phosphate acyltransferase PlsX [Eubacterium sp.]